MAKVSAFLRSTTEGYLHWCPACNQAHHIWTLSRHKNGAIWSFNGNPHVPSFSPSVNISGKQPVTDEQAERILGGEKIELPPYRCHYFITEGVIRYCSDCTHAMSGQSVPLPEWPPHNNEEGD